MINVALTEQQVRFINLLLLSDWENKYGDDVQVFFDNELCSSPDENGRMEFCKMIEDLVEKLGD